MSSRNKKAPEGRGRKGNAMDEIAQTEDAVEAEAAAALRHANQALEAALIMASYFPAGAASKAHEAKECVKRALAGVDDALSAIEA
jgi:hypothetical protein